MKLATIHYQTKEQAVIIHNDNAILVSEINAKEGTGWSTSVFDLLQMDQIDELNHWYQNTGVEKLNSYHMIPQKELNYTALYRTPKKIFGVGMNYLEKAKELSSLPPEKEPVSFLKPDSSLIGPGEAILLPSYSKSVSAEAEFGIIIGKTCRNLEEQDVEKVIAGYTATLDMTAKDLHARNPRFLQISKIFDTFFSFGPHFITKDEIVNLNDISVQTVLNGAIIHSNEIKNMIFTPEFIVSYFSKIVTLSPGDIIMTGTPGSVVLKEGDLVECKIGDFHPLCNPVKAEKVAPEFV
jgi:2-keto-4-pentenoate hydratase/2-oxohepta-3-ene-1,7-dioic acid hydratase in catechol pathway